MNRSVSQEMHPPGCSPENRPLALSQYSVICESLVETSTDAEQQMEAERRTRELDPYAYRLSLLSEAARQGIWRRGKTCMSGDDLIRYAEESRRLSRVERAVEECPSVYEMADATDIEPAVKETAPTRVDPIGMIQRGARYIAERFPKWFDFTPTKEENRKRVPLSVVASIFAVAVSMMLIVASALMVINTETEISQLNADIATLSEEVSDLRSDLESGHDLMEIRRIAVEEYGMVEESYVRMDYLSPDRQESVEIYEQDEKETIGLGAILSAMGWKK